MCCGIVGWAIELRGLQVYNGKEHTSDLYKSKGLLHVLGAIFQSKDS